MRLPRSWLLLCALHGVSSVLLWWVQPDLLDLLTWRADDGLARPWTPWTSAWVHQATPSLITDQLLLGVITAFAWIVRPPWPATLAWCLAWPLSQISLGLWPQIGYAVGLSGVLHAAWAVLAVQLLLGHIRMPLARRWGTLMLLGLLLRLGLDQAWHHPVVWDSGNDRSLVLALHLTGSVFGALLGALAVSPAVRRLREPRSPVLDDSVHP